ncbi:hypothetical protein [Pandoraea sputorum]|uniref:hypothetical protein n=1 Tax=Pandoraea sputorum TaxID=93222 RepID=UPI00123F52FF|nr:hypothetical protein [Pandoraea sputorum]VVE59499.1 hypothetical protein PSP20601_05555 [Pandoraea sputorum]
MNAGSRAIGRHEAVRCRERAAYFYVRAGRPELAEHAYREAGLTELETYERVARAFMQDHQYLRAAHAWQNVAAYAAKDLVSMAAFSHEQAAKAYLALRRPERAAEDFQRAGDKYMEAGERAIEPHDAVRWRERAAHAYVLAGSTEQAVHAYRQAGLTEQDAYARVAGEYMQAGQFALAAAAFRRAGLPDESAVVALARENSAHADQVVGETAPGHLSSTDKRTTI